MKIIFLFIILTSFFFIIKEPENKIGLIGEQKNTPINKFSNNFMIRNVRFYDGEQLIESTDVLIHENRVAEVGSNLSLDKQLPSFDAYGKTLLPGLIDSHTHAYGHALRNALNFGVTTELDMFNLPAFANIEQAKRENQANVNSADLFSATILATAPGGHGTEYGVEIPVLDNVEQVENFVAQRIAQGADYIKTVYQVPKTTSGFLPSINDEILAKLVESSHNHQKMLVVHIDDLASAKVAIKLGADGIVHSFMDTVIDDELINLMQRNNAFIIPTLSVQASAVQKGEGKKLLSDERLKEYLTKEQRQQLDQDFPPYQLPSEAFERALISVKRLLEAGVTILAGSDASNPGTSHGVSLHGELFLLTQAGLTNEQAIHSATGAARDYFPIGLRGTLLNGAMASMILVNGNPFEDIQTTRDIHSIWKNGQYFFRNKPKKSSESHIKITKSPIKITKGMINDFEQNKFSSMVGGVLVASTDKLVGGKSEITIQLKLNPDESNQYLHLDGNIKKGFKFPWAGLAFLPSGDNKRGLDLSNIKLIRFDARSDGKEERVSVLLFQTGQFSEQLITVTADWRNYQIFLSEYNNINLSNISNISIIKTQELGAFELMIDNLRLE